VIPDAQMVSFGFDIGIHNLVVEKLPADWSPFDTPGVVIHKAAEETEAVFPLQYIDRKKICERKRSGKVKQPYCFEVNGRELFAFAGIWDCWRDRNGTAMETCSILTTTANSVTRIVHDRMPVILNPDSYDLWLDPGMKDVSAASELLKPYDARIMRCYPVNSKINSAVNDDEECSRRVEPAVLQHHLFS
jgi:SOS response associated peptidase (SRAP)